MSSSKKFLLFLDVPMCGVKLDKVNKALDFESLSHIPIIILNLGIRTFY